MSIFDVLTLIGGLCLFLFGMNLMGDALERRAGSKLQSLLAKLTSNKIAGFLTGLGITAVIQSSSATTPRRLLNPPVRWQAKGLIFPPKQNPSLPLCQTPRARYYPLPARRLKATILNRQWLLSPWRKLLTN